MFKNIKKMNFYRHCVSVTQKYVYLFHAKPHSTAVNFQNGSLGANADFCLIEGTSNRNQRKRALIMAGENIYDGDLQESQQFDTYICLRNKVTNKATIVPVQQALLSNHIYEKLQAKEALPILSKEVAAKKLLKEYGGRKASRYVANREEMMVNVNVVRKELDETVQSSVREDEDDDTLPEVNASNAEYLGTLVPKCDKTATKVSEVYDVEDVVPKTLLDRLDEEAKSVHAAPLETLPLVALHYAYPILFSCSFTFLVLNLIIYASALRKFRTKRTPPRRTFLILNLLSTWMRCNPLLH